MQAKYLLLLGVSSLASATDAPVTTGNDPKVGYKATLPKLNSTTIRGSIYGHSKPDGQGVLFNVKFTGFPVDGGPYLYHIHEKPVPADGNCTATGAHLDPYARGETPPCDPTQPATCQVGDLSGKHGKPVSGDFTTIYNDFYISTIEGSQAFFGNRSVVVHNKDKVRLTCANFKLVPAKNGTLSTYTKTKTSTTASATVSTILPTTTAQVTTTAASTTTSTPAISTGGASVRGLSAAALLFGGAAFFL